MSTRPVPSLPRTAVMLPAAMLLALSLTAPARANGCGLDCSGTSLSPDWGLRDASALEVDEPLLAIGHANTATAIGGWLVLAGPVIRASDSVVWVDIAAPVNYSRINEFFGGGSSGAALIDIDGPLVSILCCEQDWGQQITLRGSRLAEPLLRRRVVLDEPYFVGGLAPAALERELIAAGLGRRARRTAPRHGPRLLRPAGTRRAARRSGPAARC